MTDNGDGTYSATYTAPEKLGQVEALATVTSTINGDPGNPASIVLTLSPAGNEDGDGVDDAAMLGDFDSDGVPDIQDADIDGDGTINTEDGFPQKSLKTNDADNDGLGDNEDDDGDGVDDYRDLDSDNDGISDAIEAAPRQSSTMLISSKPRCPPLGHAGV